MLIKFKKAQSTAEYAILFAIVVGAAIAVQARVKKTLEARVLDGLNDYRVLTGGTTPQWEGIESNTETADQQSNRQYAEDYEVSPEAPFIVESNTFANYTRTTKQ